MAMPMHLACMAVTLFTLRQAKTEHLWVNVIEPRIHWSFLKYSYCKYFFSILFMGTCICTFMVSSQFSSLYISTTIIDTQFSIKQCVDPLIDSFFCTFHAKMEMTNNIDKGNL